MTSIQTFHFERTRIVLTCSAFCIKCNLTYRSLSTVRNTKGCSVSIPSKLSHNIRASVTRRICCSWAKVKLDSNPPFSYQNLSPVIDIYVVHISLDSFYSSILVKILTQDATLWYISQKLKKFKNWMKFQSHRILHYSTNTIHSFNLL